MGVVSPELKKTEETEMFGGDRLSLYRHSNPMRNAALAARNFLTLSCTFSLPVEDQIHVTPVLLTLSGTRKPVNRFLEW